MDLEQLIKELDAKAWQSTRHRSGKNGKHPFPREQHVCYRAARKLEELIAAPRGHVAVGVVRETFTRLLGLWRDQRAYSWHEVQHALKAVDEMRSNGPSATGGSSDG